MKITNKYAFYDYNILSSFEAGINLLGAEVKSVRDGKMSLRGAYVKIIGMEVFLVNAEIFPYSYARLEGYDPRRTRKLLLHKKEIASLIGKVSGQGLTLIPLECYNSHGYIKLKIGLGRGKKEYEKREKLKRRDMDRDVKRELRGKL